ncbi:MAG: endonuclease [Deltaproteobacteria bacterium]|nr:endonuclease [Deltaproteobacteria bacterium]
MAREREKLQRSLREAEKRARGASQRAVDQPETLGKTPRPREVASRMAEVRWSPGEECFEAIASELERADRTIDVCVFTITDDRLANALLAAHRRGVKVRVLTDNDKAEDEGSDVRRIERGGVPVRVDRTEYHMHHKFAVFDGRRAITGSYNWTRGAARNNEEHIVLTDEPRIVKELARGFQRLWERLAPPAD